MAERSVLPPVIETERRDTIQMIVGDSVSAGELWELPEAVLGRKIPREDRLVATAVLFRQGVSASEISRRFGISREQTRKDLGTLGFVTSSIRKSHRAETAARIHTLAASGKSASQIAEQIEETEMTVRRIGKEFGIKLPRPVTKSSTHGTVNSYNKGCHCPECRHANTVFCAERRTLRRSRVAEMPPDKHGTVSGYENWGCKCEACSLAGTEHRRTRLQIPEQDHPRKSEKWSPEEDDLISDYSLTARQLAIVLNRTISSVNTRRRILKIKSLQPSGN